MEREDVEVVAVPDLYEVLIYLFQSLISNAGAGAAALNDASSSARNQQEQVAQFLSLRVLGGAAPLATMTDFRKSSITRQRLTTPGGVDTARPQDQHSGGESLIHHELLWQQSYLPQHGRVVPINPLTGEFIPTKLHDHYEINFYSPVRWRHVGQTCPAVICPLDGRSGIFLIAAVFRGRWIVQPCCHDEQTKE